MRTRLVLSTVAALALPLAACGGGGGSSDDSSAPAAGSGVCGSTSASGGLLASICDKGTLTVSTDPKYPPQSSLDEQTGKYVGFDIDVATEIAHRLGVGVDWQTPQWETITSGSWSGRWDLSVGSMTPTNDRQQVLDFSQPYYYTPAVVVVNKANTSVSDVTTDLDGAKIGVCSGCTYEQFLNKSLEIKGFTFDFSIDDADVVGYNTDTTALDDLALGDGTRLDAVMTSLTTAQGYVDAGKPVKIVGDPVFYEPLAAAVDKGASEDPTSFADAVDKIVGEMHADGTLTAMSKKWYGGTDLTAQQ
ncbi:MAG: transporter substrate-binding domain-containing protein [Nocardioidaceae bacterium]